MTIDETIKFYENLAKTNESNIVPTEDYQNMPWIDESNEHYKKMALRYYQISDWLKELKAYRDMRNKVIDELEDYKIIGSQMECFGTTEENAKEYIPIDTALDIINKHLGETKINKKEIEECIDIKPLSEEHIMKIIYTGYSQHDAEAHYDCPYCGRDYGGWELFRDGISQGSVFICKECHKKIMY